MLTPDEYMEILARAEQAEARVAELEDERDDLRARYRACLDLIKTLPNNHPLRYRAGV